jgi:hypothetical protein
MLKSHEIVGRSRVKEGMLSLIMELAFSELKTS